MFWSLKCDESYFSLALKLSPLWCVVIFFFLCNFLMPSSSPAQLVFLFTFSLRCNHDLVLHLDFTLFNIGSHLLMRMHAIGQIKHYCRLHMKTFWLCQFAAISSWLNGFSWNLFLFRKFIYLKLKQKRQQTIFCFFFFFSTFFYNYVARCFFFGAPSFGCKKK